MIDTRGLDFAERFRLINSYPIKIIQNHENGEQCRKHRKKRINKKWRKRYGVYDNQLLVPGCVVLAMGQLLMSKKTYNEIKKELAK